MRNTFFFLLSACFFVLTSCESTLDTSIEQVASIEQTAEFRHGEQAPCVPDNSENCAEDLVNCRLRGSTSPDPYNTQECITGEAVIQVQTVCPVPDNPNLSLALNRLCECEDPSTQMQVIRDAVANFKNTMSPCESDYSFSVTYYSVLPRGNRIRIYYVCCPSETEVGPPIQ